MMSRFLSRLRLRLLKPNLKAATAAALRLNNGRNETSLLVSHKWGGGVARHVYDLSLIIACADRSVLLMEPVGLDRIALRPPDMENDNLVILDLNWTSQSLAEIIKVAGISRVHFQSLAGYPTGVGDWLAAACATAAIPYDVTLHDYISICPRVHLIDEAGHYCGEPDITGCQACISKRGSPFGRVSVSDWRKMHEKLLRGARTIVLPHNDLRERLARHWPDLSFTVRPHPELHLKIINVALIGTLDHHKGLSVVLAVARAAKRLNLPLHFSIIGSSAMDRSLRNLSNVTLLGRYKDHDLSHILSKVKPDLVWFASTWPETYSYTLSTALHSGLPCIAFDLGAPSHRIKESKIGKVLPYTLIEDPDALARAILVAGTPSLANAKDLAAEHAPF